MATPDKKTSGATGTKASDKKSDTKETPSKGNSKSSDDTRKAEKNMKK